MKKFLSILLVCFLVLPACKKDSNRKIKKNHRQSVGSSAADMLSNRKYDKLTVQLIYMTGYKPTEVAVANMVKMLNSRCNKPDGVSIIYKEISAQGKSAYTLSDIKDIEDDSRSEFTTSNNIVVTILFLDGPSSDNIGNAVVLGEAYYNTSLAIFEYTVHDYSNGFGEPDRDKLETLILNHEFGHLFGLVNLGTSMQSNHEDGAYPGHCNNPDCLMYWEAETGNAVANILGNSPIPTFDANCISDLQSNGGK